MQRISYIQRQATPFRVMFLLGLLHVSTFWVGCGSKKAKTLRSDSGPQEDVFSNSDALQTDSKVNETASDPKNAEEILIEGSESGVIPAEKRAPLKLAEVIPSYTLRRLTKLEIGHTLQDLFAVQLTAKELNILPDELRTGVFSNSNQTVFKEHPQAFQKLAKIVVQKIGAPSKFIARFADCTNFETKCKTSFISNLGFLMFRKPLTDDLKKRLLTTFNRVYELHFSFEKASVTLFELMLQLPQFLYRLESENLTDDVRVIDS